MAELGIDGRRFTVDGAPTFLLSVSYYGALGADPSAMEADLDALAVRGFNNVRVFATYWDDGAPSVFDAEGEVLPAGLARIEQLLELAAARGITVDVSFDLYSSAREGYYDGVERMARALLPYRNAFFDLANEFNHPDGGSVVFSAEEVVALAESVRAIDPTRLLTASTCCVDFGDETADAVGQAAIFPLRDLSNTFASPHFLRDDGWSENTGARLRLVRERLTAVGWDGPIYLQEENRYGFWLSSDAPPEEFFEALGQTHEAYQVDGAAAGWCFHNDAGFYVSASSLMSELAETDPAWRPLELAVLNGLASSLDR